MHKTEKMYVPSLIFGHLLTSSNFDDTQRKVTGGRNGFGAKLCNVFSKKFTVETASRENKRRFKQTWLANMGKACEPTIVDYPHDTDYTQVPSIYYCLSAVLLALRQKQFSLVFCQQKFETYNGVFSRCQRRVVLFLSFLR